VGAALCGRKRAALVPPLLGHACLTFSQPASREFESLCQAITDLRETLGPRYPRGQAFLSRLDSLEGSTEASAVERERPENGHQCSTSPGSLRRDNGRSHARGSRGVQAITIPENDEEERSRNGERCKKMRLGLDLKTEAR
jgi:hypothetical protein